MSDLLAGIGYAPTAPKRLPRVPRGNRCAADMSSEDQRHKFIARLADAAHKTEQRGETLKARSQIRGYQDRINGLVRQRAELGRGKGVASQRAEFDKQIKILRDKIKQLKPAAALR